MSSSSYGYASMWSYQRVLGIGVIMYRYIEEYSPFQLNHVYTRVYIAYGAVMKAKQRVMPVN